METKIDLKEEIRRLSIETKFSSKLLEKDYHLTRILHKISEKKIKDLVEAHKFKHEETQPNGKITVSMGVSTFPQDGESFDQLVDLADKRLYQAKAKGRNLLVLE